MVLFRNFNVLQMLSILLSGVLLCLSTNLSAATVSAEYKLKAALIFKLTKFVTWPESSIQTADHFNICLLGNDSFGEALDALELKKTRVLPIKVHRFKQSESVRSNCHILFISLSKQVFEKEIINSYPGQSMLTLGESDNFAIHGGMIQFSFEGKRIGFKINIEQVKKSNLKIAAPLLQLATIVKSEDN